MHGRVDEPRGKDRDWRDAEFFRREPERDERYVPDNTKSFQPQLRKPDQSMQVSFLDLRSTLQQAIKTGPDRSSETGPTFQRILIFVPINQFPNFLQLVRSI